MMKTVSIMIIVLVALANHALAETPEEKGLHIALETDRRDSGYGDYVVDGKMILTSPSGNQATRSFEMRTLEVTDDGDKRLVMFLRPRDVEGTVSLIYSHGLQPDDQWIFLPALNRTKRLAARDKTGAFMGSEFAFEDIGTWEVKKYTYRWLRDEPCDGNDCFVIENTPAYAFSGYSRQVEWVDKEIYHPRQIEYYDLNGRLLKVLSFYDYKKYAGRYWRPDRVVMENRQNGNASTIEWNNYRFNAGLTEAAFRPTALARLAR